MMPERDKLTSREYWVNEEQEHVFSRHYGHGIDTFIKKYIPPVKSGDCIEIGSYPGPFLASFGDLGYTLNGIDFHPRNKDKVPQWLQSLNFPTASFVTEDFFEYSTTKKFDVVASFGFIEHFQNYEAVILKHAALVNENGYLLITTPNFRGFIQHWLHKTFDKANLSLHNRSSMQPGKWAALLEENGFEVIYKGHFGDFWFWRATEKMSPLKRRAIWFIERIIPRLRKLLWFQSSIFSAYCGIVAKRK